MQALVAVNEWPLVWMGYDTATTRTLFSPNSALDHGIPASFVSFGLIYTLSFMTAETLTRRAFGTHPQFWRVWERHAGASVELLGRTVGGYLLVAVFFAYDVALYVVTTHRLGWWAPSEALFHPDVLAAYVPWFSAIANSLQAGFWEECLFRAVPIAGAALIGERLGFRRSAIVIAFVVQAVVFGSGHAPYPNQPFFARPVELILPSIGFGLLYLWLGLVPGIILHFTFDTTWFALPLFVAHAPGIWIQRVMVVVVVLVPLWVVLWRRVQMGRWTHLAAGEERKRRLDARPDVVPRPAVTPVTPVAHVLSNRRGGIRAGLVGRRGGRVSPICVVIRRRCTDRSAHLPSVCAVRRSPSPSEVLAAPRRNAPADLAVPPRAGGRQWGAAGVRVRDGGRGAAPSAARIVLATTAVGRPGRDV